MKFIAVFVLYLMCVSPAISQTVAGKPWAIRLSWDEADTAVAEQVDNYIVSWFDGSRQTWVKLTDVAPNADRSRLSYATKLEWIKSTLQVGSEICMNVIAQSRDKFSEPSESACGVITSFDEPVELTVSAPTGLTIEFSPTQ